MHTYFSLDKNKMKSVYGAHTIFKLTFQEHKLKIMPIKNHKKYASNYYVKIDFQISSEQKKPKIYLEIY